MRVSSYTIILEIQLYDINIHYNTVNMIKLSLLKTEIVSIIVAYQCVINQTLPWLHQHSFNTFSWTLKFVVKFLVKLYLHVHVIVKTKCILN